MERRRAILIAGAVTVTALSGATAFGASTGLLGFSGSDPTPATATAHAQGVETRVVHLPGNRPTVPTTGTPDVSRPTAAPPSGSALAAAPTGAVAPRVAAEVGDDPVTPPAAIVNPSDDDEAEPEPGEPEGEIERPEAPETEKPEDREGESSD